MQESVCDNDRANGIDSQVLTNSHSGVLMPAGDAAVVDEAIKAAILMFDEPGGSLDGCIIGDINHDSLNCAFEVWENSQGLDSLPAILGIATANEDMIDIRGADEVFGRFKAKVLVGTCIELAVELLDGSYGKLEIGQSCRHRYRCERRGK